MEGQNVIRNSLGKKFSLNIPLPGLDLAPYIISDMKFPNRPVYFNTQDNPTQGSNQVNFLGIPYDAVPNPCSVEAILVAHKNRFWKLTSYYNAYSNTRYDGVTHELYNLSEDTLELNNLYDRPQYLKIQQQLTDLLSKYSFLYK